MKLTTLRCLRHIPFILPAFSYVPRLIPSYRLTKSSLSNYPGEVRSRNRLLSNQQQALYPVFGMLSHDMALGYKDSSIHKFHVGSISVRFTLMIGLMDDVLDNPTRDLTERKAFVTNLFSQLLEGARHDSSDMEERLCYWLARQLYVDFFSKDKEERAKPVFQECISWLTRQYKEHDPERLLIIEQGAGGSFCEMIPILSEIEMDCSFPAARAAARLLGAGSQLLDDWADLSRDLNDHINTYATIRLKQEGDKRTVREAIRRRYFDLADALIERGSSTLESGFQKYIYRVMSGLIDARYRWFWGPYRNHWFD